MSTSGIEIERAHRLDRVGNQRPIIAKFLNFKDKEKIKSKIRQLQSDDDSWVNPHRVTDDFAPGIREDRKELYQYMKLAKGEECNAYLSFNILVIDGATFIFDRVKSELEAVRKRDGQTASYYNTLFTTRSNSSSSARYVDTRDPSDDSSTLASRGETAPNSQNQLVEMSAGRDHVMW